MGEDGTVTVHRVSFLRGSRPGAGVGPRCASTSTLGSEPTGIPTPALGPIVRNAEEAKLTDLLGRLSLASHASTFRSFLASKSWAGFARRRSGPRTGGGPRCASTSTLGSAPRGLPDRAASGSEAPRSRCSSLGDDPTSPLWGFAQKITPASSRSIFIVQGGPSAQDATKA